LSTDPHSHLAGILSLATKAKRPLNESGLEVGYMKLVAGTGFEPIIFGLLADERPFAPIVLKKSFLVDD
jgi:hypothetical protein